MNVNYSALEKINQQFQKDELDMRENMNGLTYKNDELTAKIQLQEQQIQERREEKSGMENHNQQLRRVKRQVESENQQLREENTKSIDEIRQLRQAKGQMENQIQQLQQEKSEMENENQRIRREKSQLENENQQLRQEIDDIISEMQEIRQEKNNMEIEIQQYRENAMSSIFAESGSVVVSNEELGRGAWGAVFRGDFYGTKVAVKEFHQIIISPHNAGILDREIEIASQCRHPNLLQFICATENDHHHLLIVTEFMDMTLRTLLEQRAREKLQLKYQEVKSISFDVARGLNYLHSKTPNPIIHRDVSSANVLLWIENGAVRRAKISDYGSANFMKVSKTANPGSAFYAAPEASREIQDPKVNIFESIHTNQ
jgi:myosin heavy subunit